jgi:hypothetical protein
MQYQLSYCNCTVLVRFRLFRILCTAGRSPSICIQYEYIRYPFDDDESRNLSDFPQGPPAGWHTFTCHDSSYDGQHSEDYVRQAWCRDNGGEIKGVAGKESEWASRLWCVLYIMYGRDVSPSPVSHSCHHRPTSVFIFHCCHKSRADRFPHHVKA